MKTIGLIGRKHYGDDDADDNNDGQSNLCVCHAMQAAKPFWTKTRSMPTTDKVIPLCLPYICSDGKLLVYFTVLKIVHLNYLKFETSPFINVEAIEG